MPRSLIALLPVVLFAGVFAPAQEPIAPGEAAVDPQLRQILENQARLEQENRELRSRLDQMSAVQDRMLAENSDLRERVEGSGDALETEVNHLLGSLARGATVLSKADPITLTGELRFRTVWATAEPAGGAGGAGDGFSLPDEYDGAWVDARVRLGFLYELARDVSAFAELQSHWALGSGGTTAGGIPFGPLEFGEVTTPVDLYQGWIRVGNVFGARELEMKLGRQEVVLGNQFQLGNAEWYSGWVFDGYRFDWSSESFSLTGLALKLESADLDVNQLHSALSPHDDDELYALYFTLKSIADHTFDLYWIYVNGHGGVPGGSGVSTGSLGTPVGGAGLAFGSTAYYHTVGARAGGRFDGIAAGLDYNVEAAFQLGDVNGAGTIDDVSGWTLEAELGVTIEEEHAFRVFARFLFAEGPDGGDSGYVPLYPNRHANSGFLARYGLLDALPMFNVLSLQGGLYFKPDPSWLVGATGIWSTTDEETPGLEDDDWGWEFDLWAAYLFSENLTFIFAGFVVLPDDELQALVAIEDDTIVGIVFQARLSF